jgi:predicted dehydrogenase
LAAVCDRELLMAEQLATRFSIPAYYQDAAQMLEKERPEIVHIVTPPAPHLTLASQCLDAGCHILVEKPVALNSTDTGALIDAAVRARRKLTVGYIYLFDAAALQLKDLVQSGELGDLVHLESFYGYDLAGPYGSALARDSEHWVHRLPGKLLQNTIDHLLNKIVDLAPPVDPEIQGSGWCSSEIAKKTGLIDELRVQMRFDNVSAYASFSSHAKPMPHYIRAYGTRRTATADLTSSSLRFENAPKLPTVIGRVTPPFANALDQLRAGFRNVNRFVRSEFHFFSGLYELIRRFYSSIEENGAPPIAYANIQRVGTIMDEIFAQTSRPLFRPAPLTEGLTTQTRHRKGEAA